jgi:hypothetical protein
MNIKPTSSLVQATPGRRAAVTSLLLLTVIALGSLGFQRNGHAQSSDTYYYWVVGEPHKNPNNPNVIYEGFVIAVNAKIKAQIEADWASGNAPHFVGKVASGSVDYDRNYFAPGHPVWNWHVAEVDEINDVFSPLAYYDPARDSWPSDIAANPDAWNGQEIHLENSYIRAQIDPSANDAVANVSNRGITGAGEKTLISGIIVTGGQPRNLVLRGLGPSLAGSGVSQPVMNPQIALFNAAGTKIASNTDWQKDKRAGDLSNNYPALAPKDSREAALLVTLLPGAYTLQGTSEDGTEGVMLLEAYDVDAIAQ